MPLKDQVLTNLHNEARGLTTLTQRTLTSGAYIYPLHGLSYFLTHRSLWSPLTSRLLPLLALSTGVVAFMFLFTFVPQAFVLQFVNGPLAWITTIPLVLGESATVITVLARMWFVEEALVDTFDAVLVQKGCENLVSKNREVKSTGDKSGFSPSSLGRTLRSPLKKFSPATMLTNFLIYAPLNFIPLVGPTIFLLIQARKSGPSYHERYFQLKGFSGGQKKEFVDRNKEGYLGFGTVALLVSFVPAAGVLFAFSNMVGAALWAVDVEKGGYVSGQGMKRGRKEIGGVSGGGSGSGSGTAEVNGAVAGTSGRRREL